MEGRIPFSDVRGEVHCADVEAALAPGFSASSSTVKRLFDNFDMKLAYEPGQGLWVRESSDGSTCLIPEARVFRVFFR